MHRKINRKMNGGPNNGSTLTNNRILPLLTAFADLSLPGLNAVQKLGECQPKSTLRSMQKSSETNTKQVQNECKTNKETPLSFIMPKAPKVPECRNAVRAGGWSY